MRRNAGTKMQMLESRHPDLRQKVQAMFAEFWPAPAVKHMIETHYGERLSLASVERYKRKHWQEQRERVEQLHAAMAAS